MSTPTSILQVQELGLDIALTSRLISLRLGTVEKSVCRNPDEALIDLVTNMIIDERPSSILNVSAVMEERLPRWVSLFPSLETALLIMHPIHQTEYTSIVEEAIIKVWGKQVEHVRFDRQFCRFVWRKGPNYDPGLPTEYVTLEYGQLEEFLPGMRKPICWSVLSTMQPERWVKDFELMLPHTQAGTLLIAHPFNRSNRHAKELLRRVHREPHADAYYSAHDRGALFIRFTRGQRDWPASKEWPFASTS